MGRLTCKNSLERVRGIETPHPFRLVRGAEVIIAGTVGCGGVIAAGAGHIDSIGQLTVAIAGTVVGYWLANMHPASALLFGGTNLP